MRINGSKVRSSIASLEHVLALVDFNSCLVYFEVVPN